MSSCVQNKIKNKNYGQIIDPPTQHFQPEDLGLRHNVKPKA